MNSLNKMKRYAYQSSSGDSTTSVTLTMADFIIVDPIDAINLPSKVKAIRKWLGEEDKDDDISKQAEIISKNINNLLKNKIKITGKTLEDLSERLMESNDLIEQRVGEALHWAYYAFKRARYKNDEDTHLSFDEYEPKIYISELNKKP